MLTLRCARHSRSLLHPPSASAAYTALFSSTSVGSPSPISFTLPLSRTDGALATSQRSDLTYFFREWFKSRRITIYDQIFEILRTHDGFTADDALARFNLRLTEPLVVEVLNYNQNEVLSCLKFFDWAGRQPGFFHTRATFTAIFRILSKAKLTNLMLDILQSYAKHACHGNTAYNNVLVIGYALAGECETALRVFGRMRFGGQDLDQSAYNVLLNSLVEEGHFDYVESLAKEMKIRGHTNDFTHSAVIKSFCRQNELQKAEEYVRDLMKDDRASLNGRTVSTLVAALCKNNQVKRASALMEELRRMGLARMEHAYSAWVGELVRSGNTDSVLKIFKDKQYEYVPDVFRFNLLINRLLREDRLEDVFDLLVEMKEIGLVPDDYTMNAVLCFLCKAGMLDTAMGLFDSRVEFGLSVHRVAYNHLINTLLGEANTEESYIVLKKALEQGYFPGRRTISIVADALCREGKLDKMKELVAFILEHNMVDADFVYDSFILALSRANKIDELYLLHDLVTRLKKRYHKFTYYSMIHGFCRANRGDIAARLLIEMQENHYRPGKKLFLRVISCLCEMDNHGNQFFGLLEMQLARGALPHALVFEIFIHGAGLARNPKLAAKIYDMMKSIDHSPNLNSSIRLLQCYLQSGKVLHALDLFCDLSKTRSKRKLLNVMIVGLCKIKELDYASKLLEKVHEIKKTPSQECYEELIKAYCDLGLYHNAIYILNDMTGVGRRVSSFIGNIFLLHALKNRGLFDVWVSLSARKNLTPVTWMMGHLIGIFSGRIEGKYLDEDIEKLIQQCFRIDLYTYSVMLKRLGTEGIGSARKVVDQLRERGYEPDIWIYRIIINALVRGGRYAEARMWMKEMYLKGFDIPKLRIA